MNSKKLLALGLVALAAIGLGIWVAGGHSSQDATTANALYPDLKKTLNNATAVRIFSAGDKQSVEIARKESSWGVTERNGYPADDAKVRKLLLSLADAKLREQKTSNPENYASLGVEDVSADNASGVRIEVSDVEPAVNLIVGNQGPGLESQYVRRAGEPQSWLVDTEIDTSSTPQDWLRKAIVDISADRIQSVSIQTKGAKPYSANKNSRADANFAVEGLPKGKKLSSPSVANAFATALAGLSLSDVQPASAFEDKAETIATYRTFDGLVIELKGWSREDKRFLAAQTRYDEALAERFKVASEPAKADTEDAEAKKDEEQKPANAPATAANIAEESNSLNDKLESWVFEIADYKYEAIFKPLEELLAD